MNLSGLTYAWIALITLSGILGQWYEGIWQELWRALAAGLVLGLALEGILARQWPYDIVRNAPPFGHLGEPLTGSLSITNEGRRPLWLEIQQRFPNGMTGCDGVVFRAIPAGAVGVQPFTVVPETLGSLHWEPVYARARGVFGLAWWPHQLELSGSIQIVPARLRNRERGTGVQNQGERQQRAVGAGKELLWLREYQPGDPLRSIDWKATARSGRRIIRVVTEEQHLEVMVLVDAGRTSALQAGALTRLNHYANVAARLAEKGFANGDAVGLVVFAETPLDVLPPVKGPGGLVKLRRVLERIRPSHREANPLAATLLVRRILRRRSLVVILTDTDERDSAGQLVQATFLLASKHLPLIAGIIDPDIVALKHQPAEEWLDPYYAFAASETLGASHANALRLQRMGAFVALAGPSQLDGTVLTYYQNLRNRKRI